MRWLVLCVGLLGCAGGPTLLKDHALALDSEGYREVLQRWTRTQRVYRDFEAKIFATATFLSPELRAALVRRRSRLLGLPRSEERLLKEEHADRARRFHEFVVSVYTGERRWNDLDAQNSMWRISLANDRRIEVPPVEVKRQNRRSADLQAYFPYITTFQQAYIVRFPKMVLEFNTPLFDQGVEKISMRFLSGVGVAELSWDVSDLTPTAMEPSPPTAASEGWE